MTVLWDAAKLVNNLMPLIELLHLKVLLELILRYHPEKCNNTVGILYCKEFNMYQYVYGIFGQSSQ